MPTRLVFMCVALAVLLCAQMPTPVRSWTEAERIEAGLDAHPDDLNARAQLLYFYSGIGARPPERSEPLRKKHILWMIEHHPENSALASGSGVIAESSDAEGFKEEESAWKRALAAPQPLFDTYTNAVNFYRSFDEERARRVVEEGLKRYPGNVRLTDRKGALMADVIAGAKQLDRNGFPTAFDESLAKSREAQRDREELEETNDANLLGAAARQLQRAVRPQHDAARVAEIEALTVQWLEQADRLDPNYSRWKNELMNAYFTFSQSAKTPTERLALLEKARAATPNPAPFVIVDMAEQHLEAGNTEKAAEEAKEALGLDESQTFRGGNVVFKANSVLGRIALAKGDREEAGRRLLAAGTPPAGFQGSFFPADWKLAQALLSAGYREPLLAYLEKLKTVWKGNENTIEGWAATIRSGGTPSFTGSTMDKARYIGRPAPELRLKNLRGGEVSLADFKGKVVVVDFWATWCPPCREEMPEFQKLHDEFTSKDVAVLAVDADEPAETVAGYVEKQKLTIPVLLAVGTDTVNRYGAHGLPTTFAIDKNGLVADVVVGSGPNSGAVLRQLIETARAGAPPPAPDSLPLPVTPKPPTASETAADHYRDAVRLHTATDYAGAVRALDSALKLRPDWLAAVIMRGDELSHMKSYQEAVATFTRAIELDPERAGSYDSRGLAYSNWGKHEQALPDYTRAIQLQPKVATGYNNRGWAYLELGRLDEALADLNQAIEINPAYTTALFNRAHLFEKRQERAKAVADYDAVLHVNPDNTAAQHQKAADLRQGGEKAEAGPLVAPKLLNPADGAVFDHYPRETTVVWTAVPGAAAYLLEWDYRDEGGWAGDRSGVMATLRVTDPVATFRFVGAQSGRWRVWAVDTAGSAGQKSEWREFRYTR